MEKKLAGSLAGQIDEMLQGSIAGNIQFNNTSGGSTISITPTLTSGSKIADYSIDGSEGVLYAPEQIEYEAGENISINDGVIRAVDTTYSAGSGINIVNNVISAINEGGVEVISLFNSSAYADSITLNDSIFNYDFIIICAYAVSGTGYLNSTLQKTSDISINNNIGVSDDSAFVWYKIIDDRHLMQNGRAGTYFIKSIYGIKI